MMISASYVLFVNVWRSNWFCHIGRNKHTLTNQPLDGSLDVNNFKQSWSPPIKAVSTLEPQKSHSSGCAYVMYTMYRADTTDENGWLLWWESTYFAWTSSLHWYHCLHWSLTYREREQNIRSAERTVKNIQGNLLLKDYRRI